MAANAPSASREPSMAPIQALDRLLEIITSYCAAQSFATACKLGLFEEMTKGPATAEDLAGRVNIHPVGCRRLLVVLAHQGLVDRDGELFKNSELGRYCSSDASVNLAGVSGFIEPFYHMFEFLPDALREYSPRWQQALGTSQADVFGALYEDPARLRQFAQFMNALSVPQGQVIAEHFDFTPYHCVMDIAGGPGGQSIEIGRRHQHLRGIVTDMAPVCEIARENIEKAGLSDRFTAIPADLFAGPYPEGADVLLLGHILHDWSDDSCLKILANSANALPGGGVALISESVLNPDYSGTRFAMMKDITMLVACESGGRERTEAEYGLLLNATGFEIEQVIRMKAPRDLIVARRR